VLLPQSSQVWLMPGSTSQVIVRAGADVPAASSGQQSVGMVCRSPCAGSMLQSLEQSIDTVNLITIAAWAQ